jgi:glycine betaine/proline transport system substrate-binding protein
LTFIAMSTTPVSTRRTVSRRRFLASAGAAGTASLLQVGSAPVRAQAATPITLGVINISFHGVVGAVVQEVLERLGHNVQVVNAPHDQMFQRLGAGEVDLLAAAWMPGTHSHLFNPIQDRLERLATVYREGLLYWTVPAYVPPSAVSSIEDLLKPDVAARMDKTIRSIGPSAGLSVRSMRMVPEYGLDRAGYSVVPGDTSEWVRNFREAYQAQRWIAMPLWQPHFLNRTHQVRILADPKRVMGTADDAVLVASRTFVGRVPARTVNALRAIDIGLDGVTAMDLAVNVEGRSLRQAAQEWMAANSRKVAAWTA